MPDKVMGNDAVANSYVPQAEEISLLEAALAAGEGQKSSTGAIAVKTNEFTGRSPDDKYIVDEPGSRSAIWWGEVNQQMSEATFELLFDEVGAYLAAQRTWSQELAVGADPEYRYTVRLTTERAWIALFVRHLFIVPDRAEAGAKTITILHAPDYKIDENAFDTRSSTVIAIHASRATIVIAGTAYAGEVKKAVFTLLQYLLPTRDVLTMHCSANVDSSSQTTLFFGLSGTGKTTLSNDPETRLVGDDEHGWSSDGVFNLEGGCYAKTINLSRESEPGIYAASNRATTVLENVVLDAAGVPDFDDSSLTENTRSAFSIDAVPNAIMSGMAPHPSRIVFLTADAFGVLPPVARLTSEQAISLFLLGYTSKVAGTELGLTEPEMTFSPAFGAPFLPLPPARYAEMLASRLEEHQPSMWLVNTGWSEGSYSSGAQRISIGHTRTIVRSITGGSLGGASFVRDPVFGLAIPEHLDGIPDGLLHPRQCWNDQAAYDKRAQILKNAFVKKAEETGAASPWR